MKIRKHTYLDKEQKVFIYENKKEEYFVVAIPEIYWSVSFTYDEENVEELLSKSLPELIVDKEVFIRRILQWTGEM